MFFTRIFSFLKGISRRIRKKGILFTLNEIRVYSKFYNELLILNNYTLSQRRKISHMTFYARICFLYPDLSSKELHQIVPRSLTHSIYEKFKINRRNLTFDKLKMYKKMFEGKIRIPETYFFEKGAIQKIGSDEKFKAIDLDSEIILKPRLSNGGNGIKLIKNHEIHFDETILIQEKLLNHSEIRKIQGNDFCSTLRFVFHNHEGVDPIGASFQFNTGQVIDHMMKNGSISILVNPNTGELIGKAYDCKGIYYENHPYSKIIFTGYKLPNWEIVLEEIKKISQNYSSLPIIAADICIGENECVILEINAGCGTIAGQLNQGWLNHTFFDKYYPIRPSVKWKNLI